jgi:hypothetical protein
MFLALIAATVLMADATAAPAATNPPPAAAAAQPAKKPEMVCKSEQVLGSRLPIKKCRTAEQAAQDKQDARDQLDKAQGSMANNPH